MRCPFCNLSNLRVTDSRNVENGIRRRRECQDCNRRFTTYERIQANVLMVTKRDNRREEFDREKLAGGIRKACAKRPVPARNIEEMVEDIELDLQGLGPGRSSCQRHRRAGYGSVAQPGPGGLHPLRQCLPGLSGHREL